MITIKYELYKNDFMRKTGTKTFLNLEYMHEWIEKNAYKPNDKHFYKIFYPFGERDRGISFRTQTLNPFGYEHCHCWIHLIENENGILFTDGKLTRGQKHKSKEINELFDKWNKTQDRDYQFVD